MSTNAKLQEVVRQMRRYLAQHPNAADSLEGISRWWFSGDFATKGEVQVALDVLAAEGVVQVEKSPRGVIYKAAKSHRIP